MKYNDYELLDLIYEMDEVAYDIMLNKYKPLIYSKASEYYKYLKNNNYEGLIVDDFLQEGIIGFNHAIKKFDPNKGTMFYTFLLVCLTTQFNLMYRDILTLKNKPLLKYKELDYEVRDSGVIDPYDFVENCDIYDKINDYLFSLNLVDAAIIELRLNDFRYSEIIKLLEVNTSRISRVIKKMRDRFGKSYL